MCSLSTWKKTPNTKNRNGSEGVKQFNVEEWIARSSLSITHQRIGRAALDSVFLALVSC